MQQGLGGLEEQVLISCLLSSGQLAACHTCHAPRCCTSIKNFKLSSPVKRRAGMGHLGLVLGERGWALFFIGLWCSSINGTSSTIPGTSLFSRSGRNSELLILSPHLPMKLEPASEAQDYTFLMLFTFLDKVCNKVVVFFFFCNSFVWLFSRLGWHSPRDH